MDSKLIDKEIAARCKGKLTEKRIKMCSIAREMKMSQNAIYQKMLGNSPLTVAELATIAAICRFTREDVNFIIFGM